MNNIDIDRTQQLTGEEGSNMFPGLGFSELLVILLIVLVIFGAGKLPQIGGNLGKAIRNFKTGVTTADKLDGESDSTARIENSNKASKE